ncbi:MAG: hypothetical protein J0J11_05865 [Microbacterium sp.]|nr:hypothetical protein [Microbacterium sp.]
MTSTETLRGVAVPVRARVWQSIARLPFTAALLGATLVAGVLTGGLWSPLHRTAVWPWLAPGLPAFAEGHWWTIVTGAFVIAAPGGLALALAALVPIGLLEWSCGWRRTAFYFSVAQACGVLASAATLWLLTFTPWQWGHLHAAALVGGFSAGSLGCLAAMIGRLSSPWRTRWDRRCRPSTGSRRACCTPSPPRPRTPNRSPGLRTPGDGPATSPPGPKHYPPGWIVPVV